MYCMTHTQKHRLTLRHIDLFGARLSLTRAGVCDVTLLQARVPAGSAADW